MPLTPAYGETPLPEDELIALLPHVVEVLDKPTSRADVYALEQAVQEQVSEELLTAVFGGSLLLDDLLSDYFLRDLHARLYGDIWTWAGRWRRHEVNIGVAPEQISVELRNAFANIQYRWNHTDDWSPRELGIVAHAETVRVHPFADGNGRSTRLLADLVFITAQNPPESQYDWDLDKTRYIGLLRGFDTHRDVGELASFVGVQSIDV
jgi:fido (protein-threonine AMPylation protein)